jgi:hypothetical protein
MMHTNGLREKNEELRGQFVDIEGQAGIPNVQLQV